MLAIWTLIVPHAPDNLASLLSTCRRFETTLDSPITEPASSVSELETEQAYPRLPMRHHVKAASANRVHDLSALLAVGDLQLLLEEYGGLLVGRLDDAGDKQMVRRRRRWV